MADNVAQPLLINAIAAYAAIRTSSLLPGASAFIPS
jgi:hypothetical protein